MKQVYSQENTDTDAVKMTLSFYLNRLKQKNSDSEINDKTFYEGIRVALQQKSFCSLEEGDIKEVLTKLFLDCRDKIESFKESLRPDVGVNSFTGGKIENAERAIKSLSPSPSASTSPLAQSEAQTVIGR